MTAPTKAKLSQIKPEAGDTFLLVFILDRSGSMASCYDATISGFNEFLHEQQREKAGEAAMTLVQFDQQEGEPICQTCYKATPLARVADLGSRKNPFRPRGATPLLDAVGQTILVTDTVADEYDHVLVIIQTDGYENASREFTQRSVFKLVGARRKRGWDFVFLGADIDAYDLGRTMNVPLANTMSYASATQSGDAFATLSRTASSYRQSRGASRGATDALADAPVTRPAARSGKPGPKARGGAAG